MRFVWIMRLASTCHGESPGQCLAHDRDHGKDRRNFFHRSELAVGPLRGVQRSNHDAVPLRDERSAPLSAELDDPDGVAHRSLSFDPVSAYVGERARVIGEGCAYHLADCGHVGGGHAFDLQGFRKLGR
jgi:hypothetical protein